MSNMVREMARQKMARHLLSQHDLGPDDVAPECWQDYLDKADRAITEMESADLTVIPRSDDPLPHLRSERISVMGDIAVIESSQEQYLDQGQLLLLIQDLMTAMTLMSLSPSFVRVAEAA